MASDRQRKRKEVAELESSYRTIAEKKQGKFAKNNKKDKQKPILIIASAILVLCILAGIAGYFIYIGIRDSRVLTANITIAGVHVQGQSRKDAINAVTAAFERNYVGNELQVTVGEHTIVISAEDAAITFDAESAVDAALGYQGSSATEVFDISKYIGLNKTAIMAQLREVAANYNSQLKQHSYTVNGVLPENFLEIKPEEGQTLTVTVGTPGMNLDVNMLYEAVLGAYSENLDAVEYAFPIEQPTALDWEQVFQEVCVPVVDASIDQETYEITPESTGYGFLLADAAAAMENAKPGETINIPFEVLLPEITKNDIENGLFKDVLGQMSASAGYNYDRNINVDLACKSINGMIIMPGEVFSYNEALGERTAEAGYRPGASYVGGEVVMTYGGGICQVSSTLYYACVLADLEIVERECHLYLPSYIPFSTDATVSWGGSDYKFRNNTDKPIRIEAYAEGSKVTVKLLGTDERNYYVKFVSETLEWIQPDIRYVEVPEEDNPNGYTDGQVLDSGTVGAISRSFRNKYDKQTGALISSVQENHDRYATSVKVVVKIIPKEVPTEAPTDAPTDTPTEPPVDDSSDPPLELPDGGIGEDGDN